MINQKSFDVDEFFSKYQIYFLFAILILAFILRVLFLNYDSMWIDETISATVGQDILENGYPVMESGSEYWRAYLFHYFMAFFMLFLGDNDFGARFISVFFGVLTVYLGYVFGKKFIGGNFAPLAFAFVLAVSALEIIYSKQARMYQAFQFFYFLSFYLFYKFIILKERFLKKRILDYTILLLVVLITINLQFMGFILLPLFFIIYFINNFDIRNILKIFKDKLFLSFLVLGIIVSFYILSRLTLNLDFLYRSLFYGIRYVDFYIGYFSIIFLSVLGMIYAIFKNYKFHLSFIAFFIIPFIGLFFVKVFATRYAYFVVFPLFFYLVFLFKQVKFKFILFALLIIFFTPTVFDFNGIKKPLYDSSMPLADYKGAYSYISSNYNDSVLVSTWAPGAEWYYGNLDYWIKYSVSGFSNEGWTHYEDIEKFSGAIVIHNISNFPKSDFILTLDLQAERKIGPTYLDYINSRCIIDKELYNMKIYYCLEDNFIN